MGIDKITELTDKVLKNSDISQKRNGLAILAKKTRDGIPDGVLSACTNLINAENSWLRFGYYKREIESMHGSCNIHRRVITLVEYNLDAIKEYESDSEVKRAERVQKLSEYSNTVSIELPDGRKSPNLIYCMHGTYRRYSELCQTFEYRLCRAIQGVCVGGLKPLYQEVCLYIAVMNELAEVEEEMSLLGMAVQTDESERVNNVVVEPNINEEGLRPYFKREFRGIGYAKDSFAWLIADLKESVRSKKDAATWALAIYESDKMNAKQRPQTFNKWYKEFCRLIGVPCATFKPNKLDTSSVKRKTSHYL